MTRRSHPVKNTFWIGFVSGLIGPLIGAFLFYLLGPKYSEELSFGEFLQAMLAQDFLGKLIALGALANLGIFFLFIQINWYWSARAVIIATLLHVVLVIVLRFI